MSALPLSPRLGLVLFTALCTGACVARALTRDEVAYLGALYTPVARLALERVRVDEGGYVAFAPAAGAMTIQEHIYFRKRWYSDDFTSDTDFYAFAKRLLFVHEICHVWQHQRRDVTGYSVFKALLEHLQYRDPYAYEPRPLRDDHTVMISMRYEQQCTVIEDHARYLAVLEANPDHPEIDELREIVRVYGVVIERAFATEAAFVGMSAEAAEAELRSRLAAIRSDRSGQREHWQIERALQIEGLIDELGQRR